MRMIKIARGLWRTPKGEVVISDRRFERHADGRWQVRWKSQTFPGIWESHSKYRPTLKDARALVDRLMGVAP